jgi:sucrose-6-phosphate hydrolase SacC (GH32 family)
VRNRQSSPTTSTPRTKSSSSTSDAIETTRDTAGFGADSPVLTFTGHDTDSGVEDQRIAGSADGFPAIRRYEDNPVIPSEAPDFRDPNAVWYPPDDEWRLVVSRVSATEDRPAGVEIYSSDDLVDWTYESTYELGGLHDANAWECPDLYELPVDGGDSRWVLTVSADGNRVDHHVGRFDGTRFELDERVVADRGFDFYAAMSWDNDPRDGRRLVAWLNNWGYAEDVPATDWRGAQSVPRRLRLVAEDGGVGVRQHPVDAVADARGQRLASLESASVSPASDPLDGTGAAGRALDIELRVAPGDAESVGLAVRASEDEHTLVEYDAGLGVLLLDRSESGAFFHPDHPEAATTAPVEPDDDGTIGMRVLVDRSSVEVFADDGRLAMSALVFPDWESTDLRLVVSGGTAEVASLDVWNVAPG